MHFCLQWSCDHPALKQYKVRPPAREDGGCVAAEATLVLHFELCAADPALKEMDVRAARSRASAHTFAHAPP